MNKYYLHLKNRPFYNILNKKKDIEGRLYEGKYRKIKKNDILFFSNIEDVNEKRLLEVKIVKILKFDTFESAFKKIDFERAIPGYALDDVLKIYSQYYPLSKQKKHGVLLLKIKLMKVYEGL